MPRIDYKKEYASLYQARADRIVAVDVPELRFLMIDGTGSPDSASFADAVQALYPVAYTLKFMCKHGPAGIDYGVMPLEGLWWSEDMDDFVAGNKAGWRWTLMLMQPDAITAAMVDDAIATVRRKKNPAALAEVRYEAFREGSAAQVLHRGPFADEGPAILRLHEFIGQQGASLAGKHHEIYLSDFRRAAPEKLRTILRQPMATG